MGCPPRTILQRVFNVEVLVDHGEMELEYDHLYNHAAFSCYPNRFFQEPMPHYSMQMHQALSRGGWSALLLFMQKGL